MCNRSSIPAVLFVFVVAGIVTGCAQSQVTWQGPDDKLVKKIKPGRTTRGEIISLLGQPVKDEASPSGAEILQYEAVENKAHFVGSIAGTAETIRQVRYVYFFEIKHGVLARRWTDHETIHKNSALNQPPIAAAPPPPVYYPPPSTVYVPPSPPPAYAYPNQTAGQAVPGQTVQSQPPPPPPPPQQAAAPPAPRAVQPAPAVAVDPKAAEYMKMLSQGDDGDRKKAAGELKKFNVQPVVAALIDVLRKDSSVDVRKEAATSLGEMLARDAQGALRQAARQDTDADVRKAALKSALSIEKQYGIQP